MTDTIQDYREADGDMRRTKAYGPIVFGAANGECVGLKRGATSINRLATRCSIRRATDRFSNLRQTLRRAYQNREAPHVPPGIATFILRGAFGVTAIWLLLVTSAAYGDSRRVLQRIPVEVAIDLQWGAQDISIRKIVFCRMRERLRPFVWDQDENRVSHVLPNQEVLVVEMPSICGGLNKRPRSTSLSPLADEFLPIIYWVDSATNPRVAEEIVSRSYYTANPRRRFDVRSFSVRMVRSDSGETAKASQEFVGLFNSFYGKTDSYFAGLAVTLYPKSTWMGFRGLAKALESPDTERYFDEEFIRRVDPEFLRLCADVMEGTRQYPGCRSSTSSDRIIVVGATKDADIWRVSTDDVGVIRYFHLIDAKQLDTRGCNPALYVCNLLKGKLRAEIDGKIVELPKNRTGVFFLHPDHETLVRAAYRIRRSAKSGK